MRILFFGLIVFMAVLKSGANEISLLQRVAVFPLKVETELTKKGEEVWWKIREELTKNKLMLVASKNLLVRKDVFQPRAELLPADVILLGKLIDAQVIMTLSLENRTFILRSYETEYGRVIWNKSIELHQSIVKSDQLESAALTLVKDFIAGIPYHGYVVRDTINAGVVFSDKGQDAVYVRLSEQEKVTVGEPIHFVTMSSEKITSILDKSVEVDIFAEGKIVEIKGLVAKVYLTRTQAGKIISEKTLARLPLKSTRLKEQLGNLRTWTDTNPELLTTSQYTKKKELEEKKPLATSLSFIFNLATILLLAL